MAIREEDIGQMNAALKNRLLCLGIRAPEDVKTGRKAGAGPAGGKYLEVGESIVNAPIYGFSENSPISLDFFDGNYCLSENEDKCAAELIQEPSFYSEKTSDGILMKRIALQHGKHCLATTVCQKCLYWRKGNECHFCGIELSLKYDTTIPLKTPDQLTEVALRAWEERLTHCTLTTGTSSLDDRGARVLAESSRALKDNTRMEIHVQLEPVDRERIEFLKQSGADTIGIHVESLDQSVFEEKCPGKAHQWTRYWDAWKDAVEVFGDNQVSSYVIIGMGEDEETTKEGIEKMCEQGVIPFLVPLRPINGTKMENAAPPAPEVMLDYYSHAIGCMKVYGIDPQKNKAGCVRCGACSALGDFYEESHAL
ncbi:MAG: MSMEG_0568 family radical SAM protein [Thermoplasmata archaeon]|nr:MSMEG_0568 family radical SAM protein [Thermoplasmata archaeon]